MFRVIGTWCFLLWLSGSFLQAQPPIDQRGSRSADPMELARRAQTLGDENVLRQLEERSVSRRLEAIRMTPWLDRPERALLFLAPIAVGKDPLLAPAAVLNAYRIARRIDPQELSAWEIAGHEFIDVKQLFQRLADDPSARPDLRYLAGWIVEMLIASFPALQQADPTPPR